MVASAHPVATETGLQILRQGGNAIDAAIAVAFALAVVHPEAGNLGGGGYMLLRMADGRMACVDYRETAPAVAHPGMFADRMESRVGWKASAVPGTVAGLELAHTQFGTMSWAKLLEPARRLARDGFPVSQRIAQILQLQVPVMKPYPETARIFLHGAEKPLRQGETLRQPDLAATIRRLQRHGAEDFYRGETARRIAAAMSANGGTIQAQDLAAYKPKLLKPLSGRYRGWQVLTTPPSSGGGVTVLQMLNILEHFELPLGGEGSARSRHLLVEAAKRAYRDRNEHIGDPAFVDVPTERLISKEHARELAKGIRVDGLATEAARTIPDAGTYEAASTTHFSIVDKAGNLVSNTYTLNGFFGSQVMPDGTGVLLNDIMSAFSTDVKSPNRIGPGRRPVSSMTPTIILGPNANRPAIALGSPGAYTIPNTVTQTIVNLVDYRMSLRDAIEFPRIHHQWSPDQIDAEPGGIVLDVADKLRKMGHTLSPKLRSQGDVHAVGIADDGWRVGWSDGRRGGKAEGY
jgi:gamma-glutamyltranspeptidase/glutathione hydrolase